MITKIIKKQPFEVFDKHSTLISFSIERGLSYKYSKELHKIIHSFNTYTKCNAILTTNKQTTFNCTTYYIVVNKNAIELLKTTLIKDESLNNIKEFYFANGDDYEVLTK